jgi:hypothetical protein
VFLKRARERLWDSRTQFVMNFDRRGRNITSGRVFRRRSALILRRKWKLAGDQYWPSPNFGDGVCWPNWIDDNRTENSYENVSVFGQHGADAVLVCRHCACRDGKRIRWTRRVLRKSHSQWGARKLLSNDSGSSQIAIWHAGSRLS